MNRLNISLIVGFHFLVSFGYLKAQASFMDPATKLMFDSLDIKIITLQEQIPRLSASKDASYFFKKRELDQTLFVRQYQTYLFDEDLEKCETLIQTRLKAAEKRQDKTSIEYYTKYHLQLTIEKGRQMARYQKLFAKEKVFSNELNKFFDANNEYSLQRAERMVDLAIKFAKEKNMEAVSKYLVNYELLVQAKKYDFYSSYDLEKLTQSVSNFQKVFELMIGTDSIEIIQKAGELVNHCYNYSANTHSVVDTNYFALQKKVVISSISDYYERQGNNLSLKNMVGNTVIGRLDSLNREGVYKWHEFIVVVGSLKPTASYRFVKKGEAIIDADRRLLSYIRVNKLAKLDTEVDMGKTYVIPAIVDGAPADFRFNPENKLYQYMVCYTRIESDYFSKSISKFLPVLQFKFEIE